MPIVSVSAPTAPNGAVFACGRSAQDERGLLDIASSQADMRAGYPGLPIQNAYAGLT
jgi:hypothetical protein